MIFHDCSTLDTYRKIEVSRNDSDARKARLRGREIHPGLGLHILHIQYRLYSFLVRFYTAIMHDIALKELVTVHFLARSEQPTDFNETDYKLIAPLSLSMLPYQIHSAFDFKRLHHVARTLYSEAQKVIWALREDPGQFAEMEELVRAQRREFITRHQTVSGIRILLQDKPFAPR